VCLTKSFNIMGKSMSNFSDLTLNLKQEEKRYYKIKYDRVRILDQIDIDKQFKLKTFKDYRLKIRPDLQFILRIRGKARPTFPADLRYLQEYSTMHFSKGKVAVVIDSTIYDAVKTSIDQYVIDLAYSGYYAVIYTVNGASTTGLKNLLASIVGLKGAVFVGSVAVSWYEMTNDFFDSPSEFPCDLYYMDLNGLWEDTDGDGKFSSHSSAVQPEIWVGRIWSPTDNGNNTALINDYFNRNHRFRTGLLGSSRSALSLIDDDWTGFGDCAMDAMMPASVIETITVPADTTGDRYKSEINDTRGWATIGAHSSPNGHSFKKPGGSDWVAATYLRDTKAPKAYFYNLFACSNTRFTEDNYMGGWYIFDNPGGERCNGMAAVGSAKTGSMLQFEDFYTPMGAGKVLGEAYKDWWIALGTSHNIDQIRWFYGMVILGDPTINWWSGVVPILNNPANEAVFNHFPRRTIFNWSPVPIAGVTYTVEVDAFGAINSGAWAAESGGHWLVQSGITGTTFEHNFVGAQRGRWRVKANFGSTNFPWSEWRYFRYTV
jgi:hypothetical protein